MNRNIGQHWNTQNLDLRYMQNYSRNTHHFGTSNNSYDRRGTMNQHGHLAHGSNEVRYSPYANFDSVRRSEFYIGRNWNNRFVGRPAHMRHYHQPYRHTGNCTPSNGRSNNCTIQKSGYRTVSWTPEEAEYALRIEKVYNNKSKKALIIRFPDHQLNKEIVSQLHPAIENVHFRQPCTSRFCYVTLQESANADEIMNILNTQKFGDGFLTAMCRKDGGEDPILLASDIDPLTLYVGNLALEITKNEIVNLYPNYKRLNIGYARKIRHTRYAFVRFRTAAECLEGFKRTHGTQMYGKSLIVRFKRFNYATKMQADLTLQNQPQSENTREPTSLNTITSTITEMNSTVSDATSNRWLSILEGENSVIPTMPGFNLDRVQQAPSISDIKTTSLFNEESIGSFQSKYKTEVKIEPQEYDNSPDFDEELYTDFNLFGDIDKIRNYEDFCKAFEAVLHIKRN